jgi:hypothetical protein
MDFYGVLFGIWFGVGCYRLFEMFQMDALNYKEGCDPAEKFDVGPVAYQFWTIVSAFGWPIFMPIAYMSSDKDEE